jgi:DNA-binding XRE family transcriptional regulator
MAGLDGYTTHGIYYTTDDRGVLKKGGAAMSEQYDELDAYIAKRAAKNPAFPAMVDAALKERRLLRELAAKRVEMGLSQKAVAALMGTTQPALARLERGEIDPKLSTLERYAEALGLSIALLR